MGSLAEFLLERYAEEEWWAREASRSDDAYVDSGTRWHWVDPDDDSIIDMDPARDPYTNSDRGYRASLRSVEKFPTTSVGPLPQFAIAHSEEVPVPVAGHIVRHDPARVLADIEAKRSIVAAYQDAKHHYDEEHDVDGSQKYADSAVWEFLAKLEVWELALKMLAQPYADHSAFDKRWLA